jgi:hypothetical protein
MANSENKTKETTSSVDAFIDKVPDETKRDDSHRLVEIMEELSGFKAKMWGPSIIGFGSYHYKYESGREGDAPLVGFSPRKAEFSLYLSHEFEKRDELLGKFGKHTTAKACIYFKRLSDIDEAVLKKMITASLKYMKKKYK